MAQSYATHRRMDPWSERVEEALREDLDGEAIKKRIRQWREDDFRV